MQCALEQLKLNKALNKIIIIIIIITFLEILYSIFMQTFQLSERYYSPAFPLSLGLTSSMLL